jgi:hypothetical protein
VDPPPAGFGQITWEKHVDIGAGTTTETETLTAAFTASPGKKAPEPLTFAIGNGAWYTYRYLPPPCPLPGYVSLDAGSIAAVGPGAAPVPAVSVITQEHQTVHRAPLPDGTIRPGIFKVTARGGGDVQAFESTVQIGSGIDITSSFPAGTILSSTEPVSVLWNGGDPNAWVTLRVVSHQGVHDSYSFRQNRASAGGILIPSSVQFPLGPAGPAPADIYVEVTPDPSDESMLSVPGLTLGGRHTWKYTYHFGGLIIQ